MKVIWQKETAGARIVALGTFDGVHRGHRELLDTAIRYARENRIRMRVCTFDRHPLEVIRPEFAPKILTTIPERAGLLAKAGADETALIRFRREIADMEPEDFLAMLRETVQLRAVAAGWNYTFGRQGRGTADMLREDGEKHGYDVLIQPPVYHVFYNCILNNGCRPLESPLIYENGAYRMDFEGLEACIAPKYLEMNKKAFALGRNA